MNVSVTIGGVAREHELVMLDVVHQVRRVAMPCPACGVEPLHVVGKGIVDTRAIAVCCSADVGAVRVDYGTEAA